MDKNRLVNFSLAGLLILVSILLFFVYRPFLVILSLAAVFAVLLYPLYERAVRFSFGGKNVAAFGMVGLLLIFCIVPVFFLGIQIFQEAQNLYQGVQGNEEQYIQMLRSLIENPIQQWFPGFTFDINAAVGNVLTLISINLESLVYQTFSVIFNTFFMLIALFFFLRDGRSLLASLAHRSLLGTEVTRDILNKMHQTIRSVVRGTLSIVLIRSLCIWIALTAFGIPNAPLLSSLGGIAGAIPGLGTAFAFVGAAAYLYLQGNQLGALGIALYGIIAIILVDNLLTSYFFGKGLDVSPVFVLFAILGGILFFGPLGFILGPLVLSIFLAVIRVYGSVEYQHQT